MQAWAKREGNLAMRRRAVLDDACMPQVAANAAAVYAIIMGSVR